MLTLALSLKAADTNVVLQILRLKRLYAGVAVAGENVFEAYRSIGKGKKIC
jgi:hypothetical protein